MTKKILARKKIFESEKFPVLLRLCSVGFVNLFWYLRGKLTHTFKIHICLKFWYPKQGVKPNLLVKPKISLFLMGVGGLFQQVTRNSHILIIPPVTYEKRPLWTWHPLWTWRPTYINFMTRQTNNPNIKQSE